MVKNMIQEMNQYLAQFDPAVAAAIDAELARERDGLELIASENVVSEAVMMAVGSVLTNKYAEGYPSKRYYGGCHVVDVVENIAIERACKLFGATYANVQPHSGSQANTAVYVALLQAGDTVMGMSLAHGGHLSHGSPVNISGKYFNIVPYGVEDETEVLDYDKIMETAKACKPKLLLAGASAYPRALDFAKFREISDAVGAYLMVDMAHIAGLVAGGLMVFIWKFGLKPLGGVWGIYELLPAFIFSSLCIVAVSLLTKAPSKEIEEDFEAVKNAQ